LTEKSERTIFQEIYGELKKTKCLTDNHKKKLIRAFDTRFENAYKAIMSGKIKKYIFIPSERVVWGVVGKDGMYQILPRANFCSCNDFYFRVIGHVVFMCYHLIAQKLAEALDKNVIVKENDEKYEPLMSKLREVPVSRKTLSIEKLENIRSVVSGILFEENKLSISQLVEELRKVGFNTLSTRHLTAILVADKKKRFRCLEGIWYLVEDP